MYPFNINSTQNPISFDSQSYHQHSPLFKNDNNNNYPINSEFDNFLSPNSLFHLPSPQPYEKDAVFELTWQQLHDLLFHQTESNNMDNLNDGDDNNEQIKQDDHHQTTTTTNQQINSTAPRKRSSKKDRHSKITTASGLRDRRMRLSLPVARKFFGLQDMLGFDKASKTIEWLLTQSSSAIQQTSMKFLHNPQGITLTHACSSLSSTSECISGNIAESDYNEQPKTVKSKISKSICNERKNATNARGITFAKESRKIARERARKRTMEKRKFDSESLGGQYFGTTAAAEESRTQNASKIISPLLPLQEVQCLSSLVISSNWNTSVLCNFDQNEDISIQQQQYGSSLWY